MGNKDNAHKGLGLIPKGWEVRRICEIGKVTSGGTPDTKKASFWNGTINWCTPTDITALNGSKYIGHTIVKITEEGLKNSSATLLPKGSIIVCTRASIGKAAIATEEISTNQGFKNIVPKKEADTDFIYYIILYSENKLLKLGNGSTFLEIPKSDFENLPILLPPLPEQRKIAAILSTWDKAIESTQKLITAKEQLKGGLMQELLTGNKRFKEFGKEKWEVLPFDKVFEFIPSYAVSRENLTTKKTKGQIQNIHYGDIHAKFINELLDLKEVEELPFIKDEAIKGNGFLFVKDGDLIIADVSEDYEGIGECVELINVGNKKIVGGLHTFVARAINGKTANGFRCYILRNPAVRLNLKKLATGSNVYGISKTNLSELKLIIPPLPEQRKIASILLSSDKEMQLLKNQLTVLKQQKKGLMQVLLTGKVRVKTNNAK